jgi:uncharacterized membrane protein
MSDKDKEETNRAVSSAGAPVSKRANRLYSLAVAVLCICAITHSIVTRTLHDFLHYSVYLAVPIALTAAQAIVKGWNDDGLPRRSTITVIFLSILLGASILGAIFYSIGASMKDLVYWMAALWINTPFISGPYRVVVTMLVTFAVGLALFYFRLKLRSVYGFSEAAVGLVVAAHLAQDQILKNSNMGFYFAVLTAGVYLVVRGLDNVHQGLTKLPSDPVVAGVLKLLKTKTRR